MLIAFIGLKILFHLLTYFMEKNMPKNFSHKEKLKWDKKAVI